MVAQEEVRVKDYYSPRGRPPSGLRKAIVLQATLPSSSTMRLCAFRKRAVALVGTGRP